MARQPDGPHFSVALGVVVRSDQHERELAEAKGLVDVREFGEAGKEHDAIAREAERNRAEEKAKTWRGYDKVIERALYRAESGEEFQGDLAEQIKEIDARNERDKK